MSSKIKLDSYGVIALLIVIVYCVMAAVRNESVGTDTSTYKDIFESISTGGELAREIELGFYWIISFFSWMGNIKILFFFLPFIVIMLSSGVLNTGLNWKFYISCLCFFLSPFFYGHTVNILRQGLAFAIIVCMLQLCLHSNKKSVALVLLAGLFHNVGFLFGFLAFISRFLSVRNSMLFWAVGAIIGLIISTDSMSVNLLVNLLNSDYISGYFSSDSLDYKFGLRLDFLIFSIILACLGVKLIALKGSESNRILSSDTMQYMVKSYLVMNGFGLIFLQMPYADRWLNWSWALAPLFLIGVYDAIKLQWIKLFVIFIVTSLLPLQILYHLNFVIL